jgi:alpha-D-ribose 1-methylphosphonate 5-phosphate C-P lyase
VLQVPNPEPLRSVQPDMSVARQMHADADYGRLWLTLYKQIVRAGRIMEGAAYPALVNGQPVMTPSPVPRWDVPKLQMASRLTCHRSGVTGYFMNEIPQDDGSLRFELSDSHLGIKAIRRSDGEDMAVDPIWYDGRLPR